MTPTRDRTKLPKWAQQELGRLERDLEHAQARLAEGPENSNTFADPYADSPRPLGEGTLIEYRFGESWGEKFSVRLEGDKLYVMGGSTLSIYPQSSNTFRVGVKP